ncbi:MAG TPA: hypothetical protein DD420_12750 [Streptomyces sp.]|nr:hypothetical protein [Streptomyces sp.]
MPHRSIGPAPKRRSPVRAVSSTASEFTVCVKAGFAAASGPNTWVRAADSSYHFAGVIPLVPGGGAGASVLSSAGRTGSAGRTPGAGVGAGVWGCATCTPSAWSHSARKPS